MVQKEITILMATYNGAAYLAMQLDSLLRQTYMNWKVIIRDDGSTDDTLLIIADYINRDSRISLTDFGTAHGSACINFSALTEWAIKNACQYVLFADQDDIWKDDKIAVSMQYILAMEAEYGIEMPLLCYSTFQFIDEKGTLLPQRMKLPSELELRVLLNENHAWGCTMILNAAALNLIVPIPPEAVNHDYWIALVIAALGKTKLIPQDLLFYRQHLLNVSGNVDKMSFTKRFNRYITDRDTMLIPLSANLVTISLFNYRYKTRLSRSTQKMLHDFIKAYYTGFTKLALTMMNYRIFKIGFAQNLAYFYTLLLLRAKVVKDIRIIR